MRNQTGAHTLLFDNVFIKAGYAICGMKESQGRLGKRFDFIMQDDKFGEDTFEKAERKMFESAIDGLLKKADVKYSELQTVIGGDLLNQNVSFNFANRNTVQSVLGLYSACATFAQSLLTGSVLLSGGFRDNCICLAGSHFSTAERQYRYPLELGVLRSPVSQWTTTGVGSTLLTSDPGSKIKIKAATIGKVIDYGVVDANNMGGAMAPSAVDTLIQHFKDSGTRPNDYDLIATGDLGKLGKNIVKDLMEQNGYTLGANYVDCGDLLFEQDQDVYQGASGAACSAIVFNGYILSKLLNGDIKSVLLAGTGALLSPLTTFQGESIPSITHCVAIANTDNKQT